MVRKIFKLFSFQPIKYKYKKAVVFGLVDRAILLSNIKFHTKNLEIVYQTLINNNYPASFLENNIKNGLKSRNKNSPQSSTRKQQKN